jgi:hypothetical protein
MKARKYIVLVLVITTVVFYVLPATLLQIPNFQQKFSRTAATYLEKRIGTKVRIGQVDFRFYNQLILKDVYIEDQEGDTLLIAKRVAAGFDFFPLFRNRIHCHSVQLHTFALHLGRTSSEAPLNVQYVVDAFRGEPSAGKSDVDLMIKDLSLRGGTVSYRVGDAAPAPGVFCPDNWAWRDINAKIRIQHGTSDSLLASVRRLNATEQSGLCIKQLTFDLSADSTGAKISRLDMKLPQSTVHLADVSTDYGWLSGQGGGGNIRFDLQVAPSRVRPDDICALFPALAQFDEPLEIEGWVSGGSNGIQLKDFRISSGKDIRLALDATVRNPNLSDGSSMYVNSRIVDSYVTPAGIQRIAKHLSPEPVSLPEPVQRLGSVSLQGEVLGLLDNLTAVLHLQTDVGNLRAEINFGKEDVHFLTGKLSTTSIDVRRLLADNNWGTARLDEIKLNATFSNKKDWKGRIEALINELDYKTYRYENIGLSGDFTADGFKGWLNADGPDGRFTANGSFSLKGNDSQFNFSAQASDLLLDRLHWTQKYRQPKLSFAVEAGLRGNDPDNLVGKLVFCDLLFTNENGAFAMDSLSIESSADESSKQLQIRSDLLNGTVEGLFSLRTIGGALKQTVAACLPSLIPVDGQDSQTENTDFRWSFTLNHTQELSPVLRLPLTLYESSQITGEYNSMQKHVRLNGAFPLFKCGASIIEAGAVDLNNDNGMLGLKINGTLSQQKGNSWMLEANIKASDDSIHSSIRWNNDDSKDRGELDFTTRLSYGEGEYPLSASIHIRASEMLFNDSVWTLSPATVDYREGRWSVDHLEANHNRQRLSVGGHISKNADDRIRASLNEVNLDYLFHTLNLKNLTLGGTATGYVTANDLFASRQLTTQLDVRNFSFNDVVFGHLDLNGNWNEEQQGVKMQGTIVRDDTTYIGVDGFIYPARKELSILFDAHRGDAAFLRKYLDNIATDFSGQITGRVRLFGHWNNPTVEGDVWVDNGSFGIDYLNTRYTFSDRVRMTPDEISIRNMVLLDTCGNKATVTGSVNHSLFSDFRFTAHLSYENFLAFNATARTNPLFYGTTFGTGTATIRGTEELILIDVSLQNNEKTAITLNLMEQPDIADYDFINFVTNKPLPPTPSNSSPPAKNRPKTEIRTNLLINVNPEATLELIMDPVTGDKISATGTGIMQIQHGVKTPLRVFGNYQIDQGAYNFSFQQAFFRKFNIEKGSSINFRGDPFTAALDIKAAYTVSANLGDLDQRLVQQTEDGHRLSARDNIPVNCVLLLSGPLEQPAIKFDLELPGATPDIERQVKSYIRTDDMMNRQMIYLLLMERFYTAPEYIQNNTKNSNDLSLLTSTLASYIWTLLGNLNDKVQIDTKFHQTYEDGGTNTEMELFLSSKLLNNRLIINGNFGYVSSPYLNSLTDNIPLIGDFDIEYKLTKTGDLRLKGFNRYNYRNYYSIEPKMTQGVGILFRQDFNHLTDLFRKHRLP